jgi:hypothetical protein
MLRIPVLPWFSGLLLPFAALGIATFGSARALLLLVLPGTGPLSVLIALGLAAAAYVAAGYLLLDPSVKRGLRLMFDGMIRALVVWQAKREG